MSTLLAAIPILDKVLARVLPDPVAKAQATQELFKLVETAEGDELKTRMQAIVAEAQGESWLQRNWRPLTMLVFTFIIFNNYVLVPYANLLFSVQIPTLELSELMWELLKLGMGGYIVGRSAEKIATQVAKGLRK